MNKGTYQYELFKQIIHDAKKNELVLSEGNDYMIIEYDKRDNRFEYRIVSQYEKEI